MTTLRFGAAIVLGLVLVAATIDYDNLFNYSGQTVPDYIQKDNTDDNEITDAGATLGRVLFYDKSMSVDNTIACASCHKQEFAFSDTARASKGVAGETPRHSMRLINTRFSDEARMFWDERAESIEVQSTMPIQDHVEMGFSGGDGDPPLDSLFRKLAAIDHYQRLFTMAFGDAAITEERLQLALSQFMRSIQSFDSKYDVGRAQVNADQGPFPNFTMDENRGKGLFLGRPQFDPQGNRVGGGAGCAGCHRPPEFDIDPNSRNNGVVVNVNGDTDDAVVRAPTLRDIVDRDGNVNGPLMHSGDFTDLDAVIDHYNEIVLNPTIDRRLAPGGFPQRLQLTETDRSQLIAFLRTLTGTSVYTEERWSNPFDENGDLVVTGVQEFYTESDVQVFPNPTADVLHIRGTNIGDAIVTIYDITGRAVIREAFNSNEITVDLSAYPGGLYFTEIRKVNGVVPIAAVKVLRR